MINSSHLPETGQLVLCLFGKEKLFITLFSRVIMIWEQIQIDPCNVTSYLENLKTDLSSDSHDKPAVWGFLLLRNRGYFCWVRLRNFFFFYPQEWRQVDEIDMIYAYQYLCQLLSQENTKCFNSFTGFHFLLHECIFLFV